MIPMYESDAKDALSLYVTCLDEDPDKNDLIGDCVINLAKVLEQGEQDGRWRLRWAVACPDLRIRMTMLTAVLFDSCAG